MPDSNSKRTRVEPVFRWLDGYGPADWPQQLVGVAEGIDVDVGSLRSLHYERESKVPASPERLAWMLQNVELLAPRDGARWRELRTRVLDNPELGRAVDALERGERRVADKLRLEGSTSADCLIRCERCLIWVEGKRSDWLEPSTTWDLGRDQLARNIEAAWLLAEEEGVDFRLILCHESTLKIHEQALVEGYRNGTWWAGLPHLDKTTRRMLGSRIGTLRWRQIVDAWPAMVQVPELLDVQ